MKKHVQYTYHHTGIPTDKVMPNERYSPTFKMFTTPGDNVFRIQWHRFEEDSPLHPSLKTQVHVAFKVNDLATAIEGERVILGPYCPFDGFKVAVIEIDGAIIELIETTLSEDEIWSTDSKSGSMLYPDNATDA